MSSVKLDFLAVYGSVVPQLSFQASIAKKKGGLRNLSKSED